MRGEPVAIDPVTAERAAGALALPDRAAVAVAGPGRRRLPVLSLGIIGLFVLVAILAPLLSPADPLRAVAAATASSRRCGRRAASRHIRSAPTGSAATCSRASSGARASRWPRACVTVLLASAFGAAVGLVAGYYGGPVGRRADARHRRHHVVPGDPARPDPGRHGGAELHQRGGRDRGDPVGPLRARHPRPGADAHGARLHRPGPHRRRRRRGASSPAISCPTR